MQLQRLTSLIATCTVPGAHWLISDFCLAENGWKRLRTRTILALLYRFFRVTTRLQAAHLTAPNPYLEQAGFELRHRARFNHGLLHSDLWAKC